MIFATTKELFSFAASAMVLTAGFLVLPAYAHAQDEPSDEAAATTIADSTDQANPEVTAADSRVETAPAQDQASPGSDDDTDDRVVSAKPQPGDRSTASLIEESRKMSVGERYPEALDYALFAVAQEDRSEDPYNPALIEPLINLAGAQKKLQLDREAAQSIERAIDLIERDGGIYDARLVAAINDAGRLLQKGGEHERAIGLFLRSQHISHRIDGVFSPDQVPALEQMTRSYIITKNLDKANSAQNFRYMVDIHRFGRVSILLVPSMVKLARFKSSLRLYDDARKLYAEAIQVTEKSLGEKDLALVDLLLGLASVRQDHHELREFREYRRQQAEQLRREASIGHYDAPPQTAVLSSDTARRRQAPARVQGASPGQALAALTRAVQIVDHHQEKVPFADRVAIYVNLGDTYMVLRKKRNGITTYQQAMKLMDTEGKAQDLTEQYFGRPRRLQYKKPRPVASAVGRYADYDGTFAEASFVVQADGSVDDIEMVASNAPFPLRTMFRKEVRRSIYRPRFVDGEPVATKEHLREEFSGTALPANKTPTGN